MSEREKLLAFLFDRDDKRVLNIKFFRGSEEKLGVEDMCRVAHEVMKDTWDRLDTLEDVLPVSNAA